MSPVQTLSLLAKMSEQSVRNALHKDSSIPRAKGKHTKQIEVPLKDARDWLRTREGFTWYEAPSSPDDISVPVAKDGSFFNAACKREKGYAVGRKGEETYYENFTKALEALRAMPGPYWRRPSVKTGLHGIVRGVGWTAKTPKELGLEI